MATVLHIKCASIRKREWSKWKISASSQEIKIKEEKNSRNTQTLKSALSGMWQTTFFSPCGLICTWTLSCICVRRFHLSKERNEVGAQIGKWALVKQPGYEWMRKVLAYLSLNSSLSCDLYSSEESCLTLWTFLNYILWNASKKTCVSIRMKNRYFSRICLMWLSAISC